MVLATGAGCVHCGAPASVLDHQPPLALHVHAEGSGCCVVVPSCRLCSDRQGGQLSAVGRLPAPVLVDDEPEPEGLAADDGCWEVPWLEPLLEVPASATWPRYMTAPHPLAVGSYGWEAVAWLKAEAAMRLRWWQQLALVRMLEHDADGALVWLEVYVTTSRQSGKSTGVRAISMWRLHQADRFGEEQTVLHTGKDLQVCREVQRLARAWAKGRGYPVREQNGAEQITEPISASRWIVRGRGSVYGYPGSLVIGDEAWGIATEVVDDGLEPTMAERLSPQLVLASTAHRKATPLFPSRRKAALADLHAGASLLLEWSAPRGSSIDDRAAWRLASPHWSPGRQRLLESRLRRVLAGETVDETEDDPVESFKAQYLNIWPKVVGREALRGHWMPAGAWAACAAEGLGPVPGTPVVLALAAAEGQRHASIAMAHRLDDGRLHVQAVAGFSIAQDLVLARAAQRLAELDDQWQPVSVVVVARSEAEAAAVRALQGRVTPLVQVSSADLQRAANAMREAVVARTVAHPGDELTAASVGAVAADGVMRPRSGKVDVDAALAVTLARHGAVLAGDALASAWTAF